ncbi:phosphatidylinositol 4-kinase Pik1p [[Candida] railenensis]|uniref:1-phosphatidylinositol 4-kinase n=1 Tax=[Candida] railenensis TaxID=45579 RepID=A0A9P0VWU1_9ASCO|nr:phosphatidylinositol 4-kinase Pik1p [[Candida] railenensis]
MEQDLYKSLLDFVNSPNCDSFSCIERLKQHSDNIGIHHFLVKRLYRFSYSEIEFYIPQLVQILVSYESDSMALSDFLLDYSEKYPHFCLVMFWQLQAYVFELKNDPDSYSFHIVRHFINELQNIMFNFDNKHGNSGRKDQFRENLSPSLVMGGVIAGAVGLPQLNDYAKPLIISQARQQKTFLFKLANFHKALTKNLTMKNRGVIEDESLRAQISDSHKRESSDNWDKKGRSLDYESSKSYSIAHLDDRNYNSDSSFDTKIKVKTKIPVKKSHINRANSLSEVQVRENQLSSHSMPNLTDRPPSFDGIPLTPTMSNASSVSLVSIEAQELDPKPVSNIAMKLPMKHDQKIKFLHVNYFKKETEFMMALQNISTRLSQVPKDARLTSLRAELAIINNTLIPAEIDIPQLLPISSNQNRKFHKILKLNVNEACVLNSAERVPFLLLIEFLSEEMDFNPLSESNKTLLSKAEPENKSTTRRLNKLSIDNASTNKNNLIESDARAVTVGLEEADLGDLSVVELSNEQAFITNHLNLKQSSEMNKNLMNSPIIDEAEGQDMRTVTNKSEFADSSVNTISTKDLSTQMRIAAVMLQQLEKSGQSNSEQSIAIKSRIIESMKALQDNFETIDYQQITELHNANLDLSDAGERKLENDFKLGEDWTTKKNRIRKSSTYGHLKNWDLCSVIAKNGDDLPQEAFACQLIAMISNIWKKNNVGVWTKNMKILITSANSGLVETINNAMSIHSIKKSLTEISVNSGENPKGIVASLDDYFKKVYGAQNTSKYKKAQDNFARSLAAYSVICYLLQIKDRHNGNIMLDNEGHIIHIDFGFLLSNSPGSVGFEAAPFKLTFEYVDVLGGVQGKPFLKFKKLCKDSFRTIRKNFEPLVNIVDLMQKDSSLPCFKNGTQTSVLLRQRLQLELSDEECDNFVETVLIGRSIGSVYTRLYDQFQLLTQGIYS